MKTHINNAPRLILCSALVAFVLGARQADARPGAAPPTTSKSYQHAPVTLWLAPHLGLGGMSSARLRTNFALSLGASGYAQLDGLDLGVGASWITETMRGAQLTAGFNVVRGNAWGTQISAGVNLAGLRMTGLQVSSGFNYAGADLRGLQITAGANMVRERMAGLQVAAGVNYGATIDGAQIGIVNVGGNVSGAQIGLVNIGRRIKGTQLGLVNVAQESSAPIGLMSFVGNGQQHVSLWSSDSAPINLGLKLGGKHVYSILAAGLETSEGKKRWLVGLGIGGHIPLSERFYLEPELLTWHVNEDRAWTDELNSLNELRLIGGFRVHRRFALFAGAKLNLLVTRVGEEGFGLIRGKRLTAEGSRTTVRMWPGFVAGFQI